MCPDGEEFVTVLPISAPWAGRPGRRAPPRPPRCGTPGSSPGGIPGAAGAGAAGTRIRRAAPGPGPVPGDGRRRSPRCRLPPPSSRDDSGVAGGRGPAPGRALPTGGPGRRPRLCARPGAGRWVPEDASRPPSPRDSRCHGGAGRRREVRGPAAGGAPPEHGSGAAGRGSVIAPRSPRGGAGWCRPGAGSSRIRRTGPRSGAGAAEAAGAHSPPREGGPISIIRCTERRARSAVPVSTVISPKPVRSERSRLSVVIIFM